MKLPRARAFLVAAMLGCVAASGWAADDPSCQVSPSTLYADGDLRYLGLRMQRGEPIRIVALGSGTTMGMGASAGFAFPIRLKEALSARVPNKVSVLNKGVARQTAAEMLRRIELDIVPAKPDLVIWETGTVDAVRGVELDEFALTLMQGITRLKQAGIDVILMDPQFSRRTTGVLNMHPFIERMRAIASSESVILFDRFEMMRHWSDIGFVKLEDLKPSPELTREIDKTYDCIGRLLADLIIKEVAEGTKLTAQ